MKVPPKNKVSPQIDKFRHAARELECDDDEGRFKETVRRIARPQGKKKAPAARPGPSGHRLGNEV